MSAIAFSYDPAVKEPWQIQFESEPIDDEKWSCIVTAAVESKPGDEECLRIFNQSIVSGINSSIHIINMPELIQIFKQDKNFVKTDNEFKKNIEKSNNEKTKEKSTDELMHPQTRFREVLPLISKYAIYSDGQCILPPELMAYALKYIILYKKDMDCFLRKTENFKRHKKREAEIKKEIIKKLGPTIIRKSSEGQTENETKEINLIKNNDFVWKRSKFDLLGTTHNDGPFNGPEIYIILSGFYNPLYFIELLKINIPFTAVIKIEDSYSSSGRNVTTKKLELINGFWTQLERMLMEKETTESWKDVAMLKFSVPQKNNHISAEKNNAAILEDLTALVFSVFHIKRLHQRYIQQMKVHRIIESLELLDLSRCLVYTNLCDILIEDNFNVELFVLFAIIEQVVSGVPQTRIRTHEYMIDPSNNISADSWENNEYECAPEKDSREKEHTKGPKYNEFHFSTKFLKNILKNRDKKLDKREDQWKSPLIYLYGDSISPRMFSSDQRIIKPKEVFERFLINFMGHKILERFPKISLAEKAWHEYQFFRLWKTSKETEESFRVKLFFAIAMKLIGSSKSFVDVCVSEKSSIDSICATNNYKEQNSENQAATLPKPQLFKDIVNLFYHQKSTKNFIESCRENMTLKKTEANTTLVSPLSHESDFPLKVCLRYRKADESHIFEDKKDDIKFLPKLEKILDFQDISFLNEPSLFFDHIAFKAFVNKYHFFEELEPNRMVQQLEQCYEIYNSLQYSYFSPTDTLFVLACNEVDFQGISESNKRGYIPTPLSLRDFCQYALFENEKWRKSEDAEYIKFLAEVKEKAQCEKEKRNHEYKCCLLKKFLSMSESEKMKILDATEETDSTLKTNNFVKKNFSKTKENKKIKKERVINVEKELILNKDMEDIIPLKAKQLKQSKAVFYGINCGNLRIQVDEQSHQFHSKDGTFVNVKIETWLYGKRLVSMSIEKSDAKFTIHVSKRNEVQKFFHLINKSGTLITFSEPKQLEGNIEKRVFLSTITCPSGLMVEPLFISSPAIIYVKQSYYQPYRRREDIRNEKFRCYLSNGQILIFHVNGTVHILCPNGTKYACYKFTKWEQEKGACNTSNGEDKTKEKDETSFLTSKKFEAEIYDVLMPNGELWIRDQKSKCKYLAKTVTVLVGKDPKTKEFFLRREDGMNSMLWEDGKLVTTYPDGTKITSIPKFEDEQISVSKEEYLYIGDKTKSTTINRQSSENSNCTFTGSKIRFSMNDIPVKNDDAFIPVTCSYLLEHPKYATVHYKDSVPKITVPEHMKIKVFSVGNYQIKTRHSALKIFGNIAKFDNSCIPCGKKSTSKIFLTSLLSSDLLCEIQDFFDNKLLVYDSGQFLFEAAKNLEHDCTKNPESASQKKSTESCCITNARHRNILPELCHPTMQRFFDGRCFIVQRDLSGLEFIDQENVAKYISSLSESAYYDLDQIVHKTIFKQHNFFDPFYKIGKEQWLMCYKENNSYPITMKRKDIIPLNKRIFTQMQVRPTFPNKRINAKNIDVQERNRRLHTVIARFIRVLHTEPYNVIKEINFLVSLYQKIALDISTCYRINSSKNKQYSIVKYVTKKLELIASTISQSMSFYPHTCTIVPYTDVDIHSATHKLQLNDHITQNNLVDLNIENLPKCKQISNLIRHKYKDPDIPETNNYAE